MHKRGTTQCYPSQRGRVRQGQQAHKGQRETRGEAIRAAADGPAQRVLTTEKRGQGVGGFAQLGRSCAYSWKQQVRQTQWFSKCLQYSH